MPPRGIERELGHDPGENRTPPRFPGVGSGPVAESGVGAVIHTPGVGWRDAFPEFMGERQGWSIETRGNRGVPPRR